MIAPLKSKKALARSAAFAEGGSGRNKTMFPKQAAGPAKPAITGKAQNKAPGAKSASGGPRLTGASFSRPAAAGHTAPVRKGKGR